MDAAEETMAGSDAAAEEAFGDIAASAPLLSEKSIEDAVGEFLLDLQHKTGIPAAALLPLILSLASLAVILLLQAVFDLLVRVVFGGGRRGARPRPARCSCSVSAARGRPRCSRRCAREPRTSRR